MSNSRTHGGGPAQARKPLPAAGLLLNHARYDALNRLATAQTTGPQWGLQFSYDGFGNRTNQTVTKGSGPTHSVAIDASTNRIATAGYLYDANGNMTQMPLMTMGYDVANRMVTSNHSGAGTQTYGYNQANQRVFVRNGATVTYYLYGMGGERLMEFQETCTSGACSSYQEKQRWIYFAGRKMFSKTGATLKAITPNRLASEAKHFPYGETDGTPPGDTKDYFATYRRDGTGLDYAMNRYYSPTMGRFTTADPYGGSANPGDPQSWNRYTYSQNDPVSYYDPLGTDREVPTDLIFRITVTGHSTSIPISICFSYPSFCHSESRANKSRSVPMDTRLFVQLRHRRGATETGRFAEETRIAREYLADAVQRVEEAVRDIDNKPECGAIFNGGAEEVIRLLNGLKDGSVGVIQFGHFLTDAYVLGRPGTEVPFKDGSTLYGRVDLNINSSRLGTGFWNQVGEIGRAKILFHELGHAANLWIDGKGSAFNDNDGEDQKAQEANQELEKKCFP